MALLMIDNYDSFTYNLVQYFWELGCEMDVVRNDQITIREIQKRGYAGIVLSPGPGDPSQSGVCRSVVGDLSGKLPILGVCLGHQVIGEVFGGKVVRAPRLMHGKTSMILHDGSELYQEMDNPFEATRYHSLVVARESLPASLRVTAWTSEGEIMGLKHTVLPVWGVQFHPESILTVQGKTLLANFLRLTEGSLVVEVP
ncbi:MAG: Anthranilate synthase component II [Leptospirillum sp. Group II 'C75']|jgi:anthranilate synthase component 2|uniref:Anthranilate/aminodeoxychorismate synthase component II n=1 Tax=Leptospirillum ferriphilum TaxID=178606 RepID=A0A1V3SWL9_9BACT|nr:MULTISPECIES: aminodeoxychorismate/anthranilate synthase component II [Leptospirillum]AKS24039.1 anthranilate synthase component II [Leptospirillum sp. Group II 'CF-1']EAY56745.1 MAG: Anthranilate synthase component II [Leptospirillum rubarum]EIJ76669.1 MAG: Anthranilate synthase component II [Leptospirillum sp. Group II 'C75']OOH73656.1 anthranilate/aminodeoxychorismate synthase component II [Leptospirillum ferriphilum]